MRRIAAILGLIFVVLTIAGAAYVLLSGGEASAGYAVVPMALALACSGYVKATEDK